MGNRIGHIDGLRGLAILSVLFYHAYSRWPSLSPLPYGDSFAPFFGWGYLGVELFFIISGFVIFMTLDRCETFGQFILKRWLRLFPCMLIVTALIFVTAPVIYRPDGNPTLAQAIPGLTFIDHRWMAYIGGPSAPLEGAFWSLFAEVKFYVFAGIAYFLFGRQWAIAALLCGFIGYWICGPLSLEGPQYAAYLFDMPYWAWFACGALFYEARREDNARLFKLAIGVGAVASAAPIPGAFSVPNLQWFPFIGLPFVLLFAAGLTSQAVQRLLASRWLLFFGAISYPLYLIHEQALIGTTIVLGRYVPTFASGLLPLLPAGALIAISWAIAAHGEKPLKLALEALLQAAPKLSREQSELCWICRDVEPSETVCEKHATEQHA